MSSSDDVVGGGAELADSIMAVLSPAITALDKQVLATRYSQTALCSRIEEVSSLLHSLQSDSDCQMESVVRKLEDSERRVVSVARTLEGLTERLARLQREMARDIHNTKQNVTAPPPIPPKR